MKCINKSSREFIDLKARTGANDMLLSKDISSWMEDNNTDSFPSAEELDVFSKKSIRYDSPRLGMPYAIRSLFSNKINVAMKKIGANYSIKAGTIMKATNTETTNDAISVLNNMAPSGYSISRISLDTSSGKTTAEQTLYVRLSKPNNSSEFVDKSSPRIFGYKEIASSENKSKLNSISSHNIISECANVADEHQLKLLNIAGEIGVKIVISEDVNTAKYNASSHTITINQSNMDGMSQLTDILSHEIVHAATVNGYHSNKEFKAKIDSIYSKFKSVNKDDKYFMDKPEEFIAEFMANKLFRNRLKYKNPSLFSRIINAITNFFGIKPSDGISDKEITDAFNSMYEIIESGEYIPNKETLNSEFDSEYGYINQGVELAEKVSDVKKEILKGLKNRYKAIRRKGATVDMLESMTKLIADIESATEIQSLMMFVENMYDTASSSKDKALNLIVDDKFLTKKGLLLLTNLNHDYLGFYSKMLPKITAMLADKNSELSKMVDEDKYIANKVGKITKDKSSSQYMKSLLDKSSGLIKEIEGLYEDMSKKAVEYIIEQNGGKAGQAEVEYMMQMFKEMGDDISGLALVAGQNSKSKSPLIRMIADMINKAEFNSRKRADEIMEPISSKLKDMIKKGKKDMFRLYEVDEKGVPTKYYVRPLNYGKFSKAREKFNSELYADINKKYGLSLEVGESTDIREIQIDINKAKNKWLSQHAERRYVAEYYDAYAELSDEAQAARMEISDAINDILKNAGAVSSETKKISWDKVSADDIMKIDLLSKKRSNLSNLYDETGSRKTGLALSIAFELKALNKKLYGSENIKYKTDSTAYNEAKLAAKSKMSESEYNKWVDANEKVEYADEFYELLGQLGSSKTDVDFIEILKYRRDSLRSMFRDKNGDVDLSMMPKTIKEAIEAIDVILDKADSDSDAYDAEFIEEIMGSATKEELAEIQERLDKKVGKASVRFSDIATITTNQAFNELADIAWAEYEEIEKTKGHEAAEKHREDFIRSTHYANSKGVMVPYSYFTKIVPRNPEYIKKVASSRWQVIDESSAFINSNFDEDASKYDMQPKKSLYDNSAAYNKVMGDSDYAEMYALVIDAMKKSNENITMDNALNPYMVPQISGKAADFYQNSKSLRYAAKTYLRKAFLNEVDDENASTLSKSDPIENADGSAVKLIPIKFRSLLDDQMNLTRDVLSAVGEYAAATTSFSEKSKILPEISLLREGISKSKVVKKNQSKDPGTSNTAKAIDNMLDYRLFGISSTEKSGRGGLSAEKTSGFIKAWVRVNLLALNLTAVMMNTIQATANNTMEAFLGRYFDAKSKLSAEKIMAEQGLGYLADINSPKKTNIISLLLEANEINSSQSEKNAELTSSSTRRILNKASWFVFHELSDSPSKIRSMLSIYQFHKIHNGSVLNKNEFIKKYGKVSADSIWDKLPTLYDAYYVDKHGNLSVKDEYKSIITNDVERSIRNKCKFMSNKLDGIVLSEDKSSFMRHYLGSLLFLFRGWMVSAATDLFKSRQYNYMTGEDDEGIFTTFKDVSNGYRKDLVNKIKVITGISNAAQEYQAQRKTWGDLEDFQKYNLKRASMMLGAALFFSIASTLVGRFVDDDDDKGDSWLWQQFAFILRRAMFEFGAVFNPLEIMNVIQSPSAGTALISDMTQFAIDIMDPSAEVMSGHYSGYKKWQKSAIKLTPFRQLVEMQNPKLKRNYLDKMNPLAAKVSDIIASPLAPDEEQQNWIDQTENPNY